jgi:hypothetical protein
MNFVRIVLLLTVLTGSHLLAQNSCPKDEIFGGYAALIPNGWGDLFYKVNTIPNAFDASNTFYFSGAHNLGLLMDGSGHFRGSTTPPNLENGSNDSTGVGYALGGVQYKWHSEKLSPFLRAMVGGASISPDCCHGNEWNFAAGGGGGLDLTVTPRVSLRLAQIDYIYSSYSHVFPSTHPTQWNSVRLAAGVVLGLGNYCAVQPIACSVNSGSPTEILAGEPVRYSVTGTNFNPKHPVTYGWRSSGGKLNGATTSSAEVDTTGLAPGSYTVTATVIDPKMKSGNSASCPATFVVKSPPVVTPPSVKCVPPETSIAAGESATLTMVATNVDNRPLTYTWTTTSGQLTANGDSATLTPRNTDASNTITVTGTVNDDRKLSASCNVTVHVPALPPPCMKLIDWGECTFEKDPKRPWRVDNDCKDTLDKLALQLQGSPSGKLVIVGYIESSEAKPANLAAQRAVNVEYYLVSDGPNKQDSTRIEAHQGGVQGKATHFYFVPQGNLCSGQADLGKPIDESKVKGQSRGKPAPGMSP